MTIHAFHIFLVLELWTIFFSGDSGNVDNDIQHWTSGNNTIPAIVIHNVQVFDRELLNEICTKQLPETWLNKSFPRCYSPEGYRLLPFLQCNSTWLKIAVLRDFKNAHKDCYLTCRMEWNSNMVFYKLHLQSRTFWNVPSIFTVKHYQGSLPQLSSIKTTKKMLSHYTLASPFNGLELFLAALKYPRLYITSVHRVLQTWFCFLLLQTCFHFRRS